MWAAVSAYKGILDLGAGLLRVVLKQPNGRMTLLSHWASDGAAAGARNSDEMIVTVAWTWASRRSNEHSVTQQSVQDDCTRDRDEKTIKRLLRDKISLRKKFKMGGG